MSDQPRRGRRPAGQGTREAVLDAARAEFAELGYDAVSVRGVARRAGVDPGTVRHWFEGKAALLTASLGLDGIDPQAAVRAAVDGPVEGLGERIVRAATQLWGADDGATVRVAIPAALADPELRGLLPQLLGAHVLGPLIHRLGVPDAELRATLVGSQVVGVLMLRHVLEVEPLASMDADTLAAHVGPTLQRYLTGELPDAPPAR
ncbi:TetR/AcrR family transcriptional regulator [Isoptericola jiangsuensis]|uniref:TetR/AcrR family transcriptional regulator n=1 Tax=Isoptericola jiangsuensis TaxID=548579 RepID=UPI003AAE9FFC